MQFSTPEKIEKIAWEGDLVPPEIMYGARFSRPHAVIGQPEFWPAAEALANESLTGALAQTWTPPVGDADFWLLRLISTVREPEGAQHLDEARLALYLRPRTATMPGESTYAYSLYPERETVERETEWAAKLTPKLKFEIPAQAKAEVQIGELGATIQQRRAFPVITAYGTGTPAPYWELKPHASRPIAGVQTLWAVVAARQGSNGVRADVALTVTIRKGWQVFRVGVPMEEQGHLSFVIG